MNLKNSKKYSGEKLVVWSSGQNEPRNIDKITSSQIADNISIKNLETRESIRENKYGYIINESYPIPRYETIDVSGMGGKDEAENDITDYIWRGGTIGTNNKIYYTPYNATKILEYDPITKEKKSIEINYENPTEESKWI